MEKVAVKIRSTKEMETMVDVLNKYGCKWNDGSVLTIESFIFYKLEPPFLIFIYPDKSITFRHSTSYYGVSITFEEYYYRTVIKAHLGEFLK